LTIKGIMKKITFKQFDAFIEAPLEGEQLDEIFGMFKNDAEREKAQIEKLELLAKRGNEAAMMQLRDIRLNKDKIKAGKAAEYAMTSGKFAAAKANVDAEEKGSSDAYRNETGSVRKNGKVYWDEEKKEWVVQDSWSHVGRNH